MSLLTIIQDAADEIGLPRPTGVISSTDTQVRQLLAKANREGKSLAKRHTWTALQKEVTHTTLAAELQGTVEAIMPGFNWAIAETSWNRSEQERIGGPLTPIDWQLVQAITVTGPYQDFRIREKNFYLFPAPPAGETMAIEYISRNWCESIGGTGQSRWAADTDVGVLDEDLMTLGIIWRFKQMKGFDYAEDFRTYEHEVMDAMSRDGSNRVINMAEESYEYVPTIRAPIGSWTP